MSRPLLLTLRALGLGDLLTAVPALRGLRRAFPGHPLVLATPSALQPLVNLAGVADEVLDVPAFRLDPLPALDERPDIAVNLHGAGPQSTARLRETMPRRLIAYDIAGGPAWPAREHDVRRWCALLSHHGIATSPDDLDLPVPDTPAAVRDAVVVHPGAASGARRWPPDRFAAVAEAVTRTGTPVVVTGSAAERSLAREVADRAGLPDRAVLAGRTTLLQLAATIAASRAVVCGDTGVGHLATALRAPSVVMFGPVPPSEWGPPPGRSRHRALWTGLRGDPHAPEPHPGLLAIAVPDVLAALADLGTVPPLGAVSLPS